MQEIGRMFKSGYRQITTFWYYFCDSRVLGKKHICANIAKYLYTTYANYVYVQNLH
jgi:hypothetical protein